MSHMRLTYTADLISRRGYSWNETQLHMVKSVVLLGICGIIIHAFK